MKKLLLSVAFLAFAMAGSGCAMFEKDSSANSKLMAACKNKKAGDMVKVDGKSMKCPSKNK